MKQVKYIVVFCIAALMLNISISSISAQNHSKLTPLASNATLAETQNWLVNALERNNYIKARAFNVQREYKMSSIELTGCQLNFTRDLGAKSSSLSGSGVFSRGGWTDNGVSASGPIYDTSGSIYTTNNVFPFNRLATNHKVKTENVALNFKLRSPDQLQLMVSQLDYVFGFSGIFVPATDTPLNNRVTEILIAVRNPDAPPLILKAATEDELKNYLSTFSQNRLFVNRKDAPLITSGIKQLAALCSAEGAGK